MSTKLTIVLERLAAISANTENLSEDISGIAVDVQELKAQIVASGLEGAQLDEVMEKVNALATKTEAVAAAANTLNDETTQAVVEAPVVEPPVIVNPPIDPEAQA